MLLIKSLQLKDFLSHKVTKIDFEPDSKILFDGPSGVGKSSIVDAIIWALYGVGRSQNRDLIRKGCKRATVILEVYEGEKFYTITRNITLAGKHTLEVSEGNPGVALSSTEGLRGYQNWIETTLIGASYLLFINSVAYLQGAGDSFVDQTATKRKELLLELVKSENFDTYYDLTKTKIDELDVVRLSTESEISSTQGWLTRTKERVLHKAIVQGNLSRCRQHISALGIQRDNTIKQLSSVQAVASSIQALKSSADSHENHANKLHAEIAGLEQMEGLIKEENLSEEQLKESVENFKSVERARIELLNSKPAIQSRPFDTVEAIKRQILELESSPKCPSGEKCPYRKDVDITTLRERMASIEEQKENEAKDLIEWQKKFDALPERIDIEQAVKKLGMIERVNTLPVKRKELNDAVGLFSEAKLVLAEAEKKIDYEEKMRMEVVLSDIENQLSTARTDESSYSGELSVIDQLEMDIIEREASLDTLDATISSVADQLRKLLLVKEALGSKGIKTVIVDYILPRLEDNVNNVLSRLSDFRIRFDTQKASVDGDNQVEGLYITIINEIGEELSFENYSGGEKLKITIAISEALASLQRVGFRIFDETFIGLDEVSTESFASVLAKMQENFGQVICISHLPTVKDIFENVITVRKTAGISSVDLSTGVLRGV